MSEFTLADVGIDYRGRQRHGDVKTHCPKCHSARRNQRDTSLSLNLDELVWNCHHCGWASSLAKEAREHGRAPEYRAPEAVSRPIAKPRTPPDTLPAWAVEWFQTERHIPVAAIRRLGITASERKNRDGEPIQVIHFPYRVDGELVNVKHRILPKGFAQEKDAQKALFGIDDCDGAETVVITEGEPDKLACDVAGWQASVSVPDGAPGEGQSATGKLAAFDEPKAQAIFANAKRIVLALDTDAPGFALRNALTEKLGAARCWYVTWPAGCKDANDVLRLHGSKALDAALAGAHPAPLPGIVYLTDAANDLHALWERGYDPGVSTGFPNMDEFYRPLPGTQTTVLGIPGNGKSSWMFHLIVNLAHLHGWKFAVCSPESGSVRDIAAKVIQIANDQPIEPGKIGQMGKDGLDVGLNWAAERFFLIDAASDNGDYGALSVPEVLARAETLVVRHGIQGLLIDPWNQLEAARPKEMTATQHIGATLSMVQRFGKRHGVHVWIVVHPHKMQIEHGGEDEPMPHPYHASDSANWFNMSDQFLSVKRGKYDGTSMEIRVWKNRYQHAGKLGSAFFDFNYLTGRFRPADTKLERPGTGSYTRPTRQADLSEEDVPWA